MAVNWDYYNNEKFELLDKKYLPIYGEGETKATQIVTAICKLVYKWYNDGDVFDNTYHMEGWANDLSSYANWLIENTEFGTILNKIKVCYTDGDYEDLLKELADNVYNEEYLAEQNKVAKVGTIYDCDGKFKYKDNDEEDDDEDESWY